MVIFIDTSSLVKRYVQESGSEKIDGYFVDENETCISPVAVIEFHATLGRKNREKKRSRPVRARPAPFCKATKNGAHKMVLGKWIETTKK